MRRSLYLLLAVGGLASSSVGFAQAPHNSKDAIVAAMKDDAPDNDDAIPLPGVKQKAFSLGLPMTGAKPAAAGPVARRSPGVRAPRASYVRNAPALASGHARPAYGRALDMNVSFDYNSANLTDQAKAEARQFAAAMQSPELAGKHFIVAGHTDAKGSRALNLNLSKRRAQSVVDYLVGQGANRSLLQPVGYGFDMPRAGTTAADPSNRRVEFARAN